MTTRLITAALCIGLFCSSPICASPGDMTKRATGQPLSLNQIKVDGWFGERVGRAEQAVRNVQSSIWWNAASEWGYEHPARWVRNMCLFSKYDKDQLDPAVTEQAERLIAMQARGELQRDYRTTKIGVATDGEMIYGLLTYFDLTADPNALKAAHHMGKYVTNHHEETGHFYSAVALQHLLRLADLTGDRSIKDTAVKIAEKQYLQVLRQTGGSHGAVAPMTSFGYIDLYERTGEKRYLDCAIEYWKATRDRMFCTGGLGEVLQFTQPASESQLEDETCQASWWTQVNLNLWRVTADVRYMDLAERILYNHFAARQLHRAEGGGFCAYGNIDSGFRGFHDYFCCDNEGTLGLLRAVSYIYTSDPERNIANVNLFFPSEAEIKLKEGRTVHLRQKTRYPERGGTTVTIGTDAPARFTLRVRIPGWTGVTDVRVNGKPLETKSESSYIAIQREWTDGDTVCVTFPMPMRVEADMSGVGSKAVMVNIDGQDVQAKRLAVLYGPLVAAIFRTGHNNDLSWVWNGDYPEVLDCGGDYSSGYPTSQSDILEADGKTFGSGTIPDDTRVSFKNHVPEISWTSRVGDVVRKNLARVLPGLPVTIEYREEVEGWDGKGRLLSSGLRFSVRKSSGGRLNSSWPYPAPFVTTHPTLSDVSRIVEQNGTFGLLEKLTDGETLRKTGTVYLNNGFFGAISLYDKEAVDSVVCLKNDDWVGVYLRPKGGNTVIKRNLIFPLFLEPMNQSTALERMDASAKVTASLEKVENGGTVLKLSGPAKRGVPILIPGSLGLRAGDVVCRETLCSEVLQYDKVRLLVYADTPGEYRVLYGIR